VQPVARPRASRVSTSAVLGIVALVGLLAAGFGALGGRPEAATSPSIGIGPSADAAAASTTPAPMPTATEAAPTPAVTPFRVCASLGDEPPAMYLRVDGNPTPGLVQVETVASDPTPGPAGPPVDIPPDAVTQVWVEGAACATAWDIVLQYDDGGSLQLGFQTNPYHDPAYASQNRFDVALGAGRGYAGALELRAALEFQDRSVVATWPIRLLPFDRPLPRLLVAGEDRYFPTVEGCNILITFRNGFEEGQFCDDNLSEPLGSAVKVEPGARLALVFDGWSVVESMATCGRSTDRAFDPLENGCWDEPQDGSTFAAPPSGDLAIAIDACAIDGANGLSTRICGTWYVRVDTR
jgi:hypothetical protein